MEVLSLKKELKYKEFIEYHSTFQILGSSCKKETK